MLTMKLSGFHNIELSNGEIIEWKYINTPDDFSLNKESIFVSYMASIKRGTNRKAVWYAKPYYAIGIELKINMETAYNFELNAKNVSSPENINNPNEKLINRIAKWANTRYEDNPGKWYHSLEVAAYKSDTLIRSITLNKAFIVDYNEYYNEKGDRIAHLLVGQKPDIVDEVLINGEAYGIRIKPQPKPTNFFASSALLRENPFTRIVEETQANAAIELGDTLDYILTSEQRRNLRNLIRNSSSTDNFFNSLSREQQRQLQFLNSERLSNLNDTQRLSLLKYLDDNSKTNRISHDFLRGLGLVPNGLNRMQVAHNIETPILMEYIAITQSGMDLSHHERMHAQRRMAELFGTITAGAVPRAGGNNQRQPQRQQSQQNTATPQRQNMQNNQSPNINQRPTVSNPKLQNIVRDLYKGQGGPNTIGNGTTMDAVRNEIRTGQPTHGRFHTSKLTEYRTALEKRLRAGDLNAHDRSVAQSLLDDIINALSGN